MEVRGRNVLATWFEKTKRISVLFWKFHDFLRMNTALHESYNNRKKFALVVDAHFSPFRVSTETGSSRCLIRSLFLSTTA